MNRFILLLLLSNVSLLFAQVQSRDSIRQAWLASQPMHTGEGYIPFEKGYVPDSASALQIGKIILTQIYGKARIEAKEPYTVRLKDDIWFIEGSLPPSSFGGFPLIIGGVPLIMISRKTGAVLEVSHGR